jgi:hypothetical protein
MEAAAVSGACSPRRAAHAKVEARVVGQASACAGLQPPQSSPETG